MALKAGRSVRAADGVALHVLADGPAAALPAAHLTIYPGAADMLPPERPSAVAAHLRGLVDAAVVRSEESAAS